jgi:hypothetical protein
VPCAGWRAERAVGADEAFETGGQRVSGFARDGDAVVIESGLVVAGEEEGERPPARRQFGNGQCVHWRVHLRLEVIDAELVKVAEDNVARAVGDKAGAVKFVPISGLPSLVLTGTLQPLYGI